MHSFIAFITINTGYTAHNKTDETAVWAHEVTGTIDDSIWWLQDN